jgi:biofilm protein TabA
MIIDKLERIEKYCYLNKHFQTAFDYIRNNDLSIMDIGEYKLDGDNLILIIANDEPNPDFISKLETHRKYIDIQMAVDGSFVLIWKAVEDCCSVTTPYDKNKDVAFYSDEADLETKMKSGNFVILMPEDAHFALPPNNKIKKAIFKILV